MAKILELDRTFQIAMPAAATGGWIDLKWDNSWRVAALLAGGPERGKVELVTPMPQVWRFAGAASAPGAFLPLLVAGPVLSDVLPNQGLPYLTITVTPTYPVGVRDPGLTIVYRGRPHETAPGVWNLTDIADDGSGPVLVAQQTRQNIDDALGSLNGKLSRADADHTLNVQSLADNAQNEAQRTAQQQLNNAQAATNIGRLTALSVATIGAAVGVYNITAGADAGQVWERTGTGVPPVRRLDLEAASLTSVASGLSRPSPSLGLQLNDVATEHIKVQQFIDSQFAARRKKGDGSYEDNYDLEHVPLMGLPDGIIKMAGGIIVPRKGRLIAPQTTFHLTANVDAMTLGIGAQVEFGTIEYDLGLRDTTPGAINGNGLVANRDCRATGRVYRAPGNGLHGSVTNMYNGVPFVEGPYGSVFDLELVGSFGYGAYFPLQMNGITGVFTIVGSQKWGMYAREANAVELFCHIEGNPGGGLRVVSGDASRFYCYFESNGQATGTTPDAADKNSHIWIGPDAFGGIAVMNVTLDGYLYSGHESTASARHLLRITGADGLSTGGLKLWSIRPQTDGSLILVDGVYGSALTNGDLSKLRYVSGGAAVDLKVVDSGDLRDTIIKRKSGVLETRRGVTLLTDTYQRNLSFPGQWNSGNPRIGSVRLFEGAGGVLRSKPTSDPTGAIDGSVLVPGILKPTLPPGVETAVAHYLYSVPVKVTINPPPSAVGTPPPRVWETKPATSSYVYLTHDSATAIAVTVELR